MNNVDSWPDDTDIAPADGMGFYNAGSIYQMWRLAFDRHPGRTINFSYVDGHGESVSVGELWQQKWHKNFDDRQPPKQIVW